MIYNKRKAIIDDGMSPELAEGAELMGFFGIPRIKAPAEIVIPDGMTPFTEIDRAPSLKEAICCYEMDRRFSEILIDPSAYIDTFKRFSALIAPDCSQYRDASFAVEVTNVYRSRLLGHYYQRHGVNVIPNVRWGDALTYRSDVMPEKVAFLGVDKHSIVAISTYGCIKGKENEYHFQAGLEAMMEELEPSVVLVYGSDSPKIFSPYLAYAHFVHYPDWITRMHMKAGGSNG